MSKYCSLKEAFKQPSFFIQENKEDENEVLPYEPPVPVSFKIPESDSESLVKGQVSCGTVQKGTFNELPCAYCGGRPNEIPFNDILNFLLVVLLIWIIIYKPKL
jgi:hypothetical protein